MVGWGQSLNAKEKVSWHVVELKTMLGPGMWSGEQVLPFLGPCEWQGFKSKDKESTGPFHTSSVLTELLVFPSSKSFLVRSG